MLQGGIRDSAGPCPRGKPRAGAWKMGSCSFWGCLLGDLGQERSLFSLPQFPLLNSDNDTSYLAGIVRI